MIRHLMFIVLAASSLSACDWGRDPLPPPPPRPEQPRPAEPQVQWIAADPECRGSLRRGEWLVCDNATLRALHRTLANEWADARQDADRRRLRLMQRQQEALLIERGLCEDAACVATAYRRYLSAAARPEPRPTATPAKPRPAKPHRPRKPRVQPGHGGWQSGGAWAPNRRPGEQSCAAEIGGSASAYLVRQCRVANGSWDRGCTADRSCADLRAQITEGCTSSPRAPGFCNRR